MGKPRQHPERAKLTVRLPPESEHALEQLARELCTSVEGAALFALRVGLGLMPAARMPAGAHALVPTDVGSILVMAVGPKDAARVDRLIALWGER